MPGLLRKVAAGARILDDAAASSIGLVALFMFDEDSGALRDLVTGANTALTGGTVGRSDAGRVLSFNGSQATNMALRLPGGTSAALKSLKSFTVLGRFRPAAAAGADPAQIFGICNSGGTQCSVGIGWNTSTEVGLTTLDGNGASTIARSAGAVGQWYTVAAHIPDGIAPSYNAWINGLPATTGQGTNVSTGGGDVLDEVAVGAQHRSAGFLRYASGDLEWGAVLYGRGMSDATALSLYQSDFPYNLLTPRRKFWFKPATGGPIVLGGAATGTGVAAGALTTGIRLAGAATGSGIAAGALTTSIRLAGAATGSGIAAGALTTGIRLAGAPTGTGTGAAALTTAIRLAGAATGAGTASAALTTAIRLAAAVSGTGIATGNLTALPAGMAGSATGVGTATGALTTSIRLAGVPTGSGIAAASLTTGIRLAGSPTASGVAAGVLSTGIRLAGAPTGTGTAAAALSAGSGLSGAVAGSGTAAASLTTAIRLAGAMSGSGAAMAALLAGVPPVADPLRAIRLRAPQRIGLPPPATLGLRNPRRLVA